MSMEVREQFYQATLLRDKVSCSFYSDALSGLAYPRLLGVLSHPPILT